MRLRALGSEAYRNLAVGTSRAALLAITFAVLLAALTLADQRTVAGIISDGEAFRRSGGSVSVLTARDAVDAAACERLASTPGVHAAGAIRQDATGLILRALPAAAVPSWEMSPQFPRVLGQRVSDGLMLSAELADQIGVTAGSSLVTEGRLTARVAAVYPYPEDGRSPTLTYAVVAPVPPTGRFDQCWVEVWPTDVTTTALLRLALATDAPSDTAPTLGQLNTTRGETFDAAGLYGRRVTRHAPLAMLGLGFALGYLAVRIRRLELSSARHSGVRAGDQIAQIGLETTIWLVVSLLLAAPAAVFGATTDNDSDYRALLGLAARIGATGAAAALTGSLVGVMLTKESHLFRYFKDR